MALRECHAVRESASIDRCVIPEEEWAAEGPLTDPVHEVGPAVEEPRDRRAPHGIVHRQHVLAKHPVGYATPRARELCATVERAGSRPAFSCVVCCVTPFAVPAFIAILILVRCGRLGSQNRVSGDAVVGSLELVDEPQRRLRRALCQGPVDRLFDIVDRELAWNDGLRFIGAWPTSPPCSPVYAARRSTRGLPELRPRWSRPPPEARVAERVAGPSGSALARTRCCWRTPPAELARRRTP